MTEQQEIYRKAIIKLIASQQSNSTAVRRVYGQQVLVADSVPEILALPAGDYIEMQNTDSTDPNFGEILFTVGIDGLESSPIA